MSENLNTQQLRFDPAKASIAGIDIVSFNVDDKVRKYKKADIDDFSLKFQYNIQYSKSEKIIIVYTDIIVECLINSQVIEELGGRLIVSFCFKIENLTDYLTVVDNGESQIDISLAINLINLAYSTSRGLFFLKSRDTILEDFILPIVNPMDLIKSQTKELV